MDELYVFSMDMHLGVELVAGIDEAVEAADDANFPSGFQLKEALLSEAIIGDDVEGSRDLEFLVSFAEISR